MNTAPASPATMLRIRRHSLLTTVRGTGLQVMPGRSPSGKSEPLAPDAGLSLLGTEYSVGVCTLELWSDKRGPVV